VRYGGEQRTAAAADYAAAQENSKFSGLRAPATSLIWPRSASPKKK